jgi:hypothetical protein
LFLCGARVNAEQELTAQWVETRLNQAGSSRTYVGSVAYRDSMTSLHILSDSAVVTGTKYLFLSNLQFRDSTRVIKARQLEYDRDDQMARFTGGVQFQDGAQSLEAQSVTVWPQDGNFAAEGGVIFQDAIRNQRVGAQTLSYRREVDQASASGRVKAQFSDNAMDTLFVSTDSLGFQTKADVFSFSGHSRINQSRMNLIAGTGRYDGATLRVCDSPEIVWSQPGGEDSVRAASDSMNVAMDHLSVQSVSLLSGARLQLSGLRKGIPYTQLIESDSSEIRIDKGRISLIKAFGSVRLSFLQEDIRIEIPADSVTAWLKEGQTDSLKAHGQVEGTYQSGSEKMSRVLGEVKTLWFERGELVKMHLLGNAACSYSSQAGDKGENADLSGDFLELLFERGDLVRIEGSGSIEGVYIPQPVGGKP